MRVLITGGAGFIGSYLAAVAAKAGMEVVVLDNLSTGYLENLQGIRAEFVKASVTENDTVLAAMEGVDSVVHLAALGSVPRSIEDPVSSHYSNVTGTLTLLEAARKAGVQHVITASSSSVYGLNPKLPKAETDWIRPVSPYAVTKLAAEQYTLAYQQSFHMTTLAFRFFNVYGPGQRAGHAYAAVIPAFLDALKKRQPLPINGDGTQSRDFTYVGSVCNVLLRAVAEQRGHCYPINLAYGRSTSIKDLVRLIEDLVGHPLEVVHREARRGDVKHSEADGSALRSLFPNVAPVSLAEGMKATMSWFGVL